jgi:hypothetical protein
MKYFGDTMHPIKSTGPCLPIVAKTVGGKNPWVMPMNITEEDRKFTKMNVGHKAEQNDYLVVTGPFVGQDIPDNAQIRRLAVSINLHSTTNRASEEVYWSFYGLNVEGKEPGTTKNCANFVTILPTNYAALNYEVSNYTPEEWGFDALTGVDIKEPSFGLVLRFRSTNHPAIVSIDFVSFTAVWTNPDAEH